MTQLPKSFPTQIFVAFVGASLATGCATDDGTPDPEEIAFALEQEDGGLDMEDESPAFGDESLFTDHDVLAQETPYTDPMTEDPDVVAYEADIDAIRYDTVVMWGQMPADLSNQEIRNWDGSFRVNRGALIVRRTLAFDGSLDRVEPRTDPRRVDFRSRTRPHRDGLRLTLIDPTPDAQDPMTLTYEGLDGTVVEVDLDSLDGAPADPAVDANNNRMVIVALRRPLDACEHGFLRGRWHQVAPGLGRMIGRVVNADGELVGHIRGVYGERDNGNKVFFGKYINQAGDFRGIFRGQYDAGHFQGRWLNRDGDRGALGGMYRENIPGPRTGGLFIGRWAETSCNVPTDVGL